MGYREEFIEVYTQNITRPGADKLLEWLDSFCEEVKAWGSDDIPVFVEAKKKLLGKFELVCTVEMGFACEGRRR